MGDQQKSTETENQAEEGRDEPKIEFDGQQDGQADNQGQDSSDTAQADLSSAKTATPESEDQETETKDNDDIVNQDSVNKKINKLTLEKHEERRKRKALQQQINDLNAKLSAHDEKAVVVPPMPDPFDDQYEEKIRLREQALSEKAKQDAKKELETQRIEQQKNQAQEQQVQEAQKLAQKMYQGAESYGLKAEEFQKADNIVAGYIQNRDLANFILNQEKAPLIVNELASNAAELEKISKMNPVNAAAYIAANIVPKVASFKPALSKTPEPIDIPDGKPAGAKKDPYLEGVIFE